MTVLKFTIRSFFLISWLLLAKPGSARADIVFVSQSGQGSDYAETLNYPYQSDGVNVNVPNADTPVWGYSVPNSGLPSTVVSIASPAGDTASASFSFSTLQTGNVFSGDLTVNASTQSNGGWVQAAAAADYGTKFQVTSAYNFVLAALPDGIDDSIEVCTPYDSFCETISGGGTGLNYFYGTMYPCAGSCGYTISASVGAQVSAQQGYSQTEQGTLTYTLTLTPVPLPSSVWLMLCGLGGTALLRRSSTISQAHRRKART